ncbi:hypothetical protein bcgnr5386_14910 [Bacillus cereus]
MTVKIDVKGPIISNDEAWIYDWFEIDAASPGITKEDLNAALSGLKNEILNDLQTNTNPKEPIQKPVHTKQNLSTLFLTLGGK